MDSTSASIKDTNNTLNLLVSHITRYLEQGFSEDKVRKALEPNELDDNILGQAMSVVQSQIEAKRQAEKTEKAAKEEAHKRKRQAEKSEAKKNSKKAPKDTLESSVGAEALEQDMAVSLHDAPKLKTLSEIKAAKGKDIQESTLELKHPPAVAETAAATVPQVAPTATEPSLTEELLGIKAPWESITGPTTESAPMPQQPVQPGGMVIGQQQTAVWNPQAQAAYTPVYSGPQAQALNTQTYAAQLASPILPPDTNSYSPIQAITDSFMAARTNLPTYIVSVAIAFVAAGSSFFLIGMAINKFFVIPFSSLLASPAKLFVSIAGSLALYAVWYMLASAFVVTSTSLALFDGSQSRTSTIANVLTKSLSEIGRVLKALASLGALALAPMAIVALIPVVVVGFHGAKSLAYVLPTLYFIAFAWAVAVLLRYALVPYVTLLEPTVGLKKSFERSKELLGNSQLMLIKGLLPVVVVVGALALFAGYRPQDVSRPSNIVINLFLLLITLVANGALVMLYCNRKIFKG